MFKLFKTRFDPEHPQQERIISLLNSKDKNDAKLAMLMLRKTGMSDTSVRNYLRDYVFYLIMKNIEVNPETQLNGFDTYHICIYNDLTFRLVSSYDDAVFVYMRSSNSNIKHNRVVKSVIYHGKPNRNYESEAEETITEFIYKIANYIKNL